MRLGIARSVKPSGDTIGDFLTSTGGSDQRKGFDNGLRLRSASRPITKSSYLRIYTSYVQSVKVCVCSACTGQDLNASTQSARESLKLHFVQSLEAATAAAQTAPLVFANQGLHQLQYRRRTRQGPHIMGFRRVLE